MSGKNNNGDGGPKDPKEEKSSIFLSYNFIISSKKKAEGTIDQARHLLQHYCNVEEDDSGLIDVYILPLVCQYYTSLYGYLSFLRGLLGGDNLFEDDGSGSKRISVTTKDIDTMRLFVVSVGICEQEMMDNGISVKVH